MAVIPGTDLVDHNTIVSIITGTLGVVLVKIATMAIEKKRSRKNLLSSEDPNDFSFRHALKEQDSLSSALSRERDINANLNRTVADLRSEIATLYRSQHMLIIELQRAHLHMHSFNVKYPKPPASTEKMLESLGFFGIYD